MQPLLTKDSWLNPMWVLRVLPITATILVALAFFSHRETLRDVFLGGALGLLFTFCVFSFEIKTVVLKNKPQSSDVNRYSVTG
jgi:hypothetical protein